MPKRPLPQFNQKDGKPFEITISDFSKGTMTLVDEARIPQNAVYQSTNMMLDQDGVWRVRYGSQVYGQALTAATITVGPNSPTTVVDDSTTGTISWSNPTNAEASDGVFASTALSSFTGTPSENSVRLVKGGSYIGNDKSTGASLTLTNSYTAYGSTSDLWGTVWSPADINAPNFGIGVSYKGLSGVSHYLQASGFGFNIPSAATIVGIKGEIEAKYTSDGSFEKNTVISTPSGGKKISDFKVGDEVYSYDLHSGEVRVDKVTSVSSNPIAVDNSQFYYLTLADSTLLKSTGNHHFFVSGKWVRADDLKLGDELLNFDGKPVEITDIEIVANETETVWDLAVETNQNYFADGILAHNFSTSSAYVDHIRLTVYYTTLTQGNYIDGIGRATVYNTDGTNTNYLFALDNGTLKYCRDGGSWTSISGKTWAVGYAATLTQVNSRLYINNGHDNLAYLDLTTMTGTPTLVLYTALSTPGTVTLARVTLTSGSYNVYYKITAVKAVIGETAASAEATITVNKPRSQWKTDGSEHIDLSWSAVTGADSYNIYYSDTTGQEVWIASTSGLAYSDTGTDTPNPYQAAPPTDGTAGPPAATMRLSGNRIWMTGNPNLPYRIYWSGVGQYLGSFNPFYGGGYIDLNLGGDEKPVEIEHYRDGKGNQTAVVLTSSPTGGGSVWFISLTTLTVDVITVVVPSALSQGTIGTTSARGVVQAQNNVFYPSIKGFQSIGSAQQILNVLVTSEVSTSIRPSVQGINNQASNQIAGVYYYGRIYWSVPFGSSTNNQVWVLDLERQAWCIYWNIGVKQFMEYTDSTGTVHLLGVPVAGNNLIEFGSNILGDSDNYFPTLLKSGLITWDKSHFEFAWVEKVYFELGRPKGNIQLSVSGTAVNKNLESLKTTSITDTSSTAGVGSDQVGSFELGTSNNTPTTYSQSSVKKVLYINKPLNNLEWQIVTNDVNASYSLISITIVGNILPSGDPSQWRK